MDIKKMSDLEYAFEKAKQQGSRIGVKIVMPGFDYPEIIVNPYENLDKKLEYYKKTYDDDLMHIKAEGVQIIGYEFC